MYVFFPFIYILVQDDWKAYIIFVEAEGVSCLEHIASLHQVVEKGYRLRFGSITRDGLLKSVRLLGVSLSSINLHCITFNSSCIVFMHT